MTEQQTPVLDKPAVQETPPAPPAVPKKAPGKKKKKRVLKLVITLVIIAIVIGAVAFLLWRFVFYTPDTRQILDDPVTIGSIQSMVEGGGTAKAKDSATISPDSGGKVLELYINEGDTVTAGQQLYRMDDTKARDAVTAAQKEVDNCNKELQAIYDKIAELTVTAPHAGKLTDIKTLQVGDDVAEGTKIATLVDDTRLRISLYYSYSYEGQIKEGQSAQITIPATMNTQNATVEQVNYVRRIAPEGSVLFEVRFVMDNPGTLTAGMDASAALNAADGTPIYPYENGKLEYYRTTDIIAKAAGPVEAVHLMNYADVKAGDLLLQLGQKDTDEQIAAKENALKAAQEKLDSANKDLEKYNAVSPIDGKVLSCGLTAGEEVQSGQGISIADISTMSVEIQLDQRNASSVEIGMMIQLSDNYNEGQVYMGIVQSVSLTAKNDGNGITYYPCTVTMDNTDELIRDGQYLKYSFVASESTDCLVVPVACVNYISDANGETATVCFLKSDTKPENAVELSEETMANVPEGYYPVPVEVGLADNFNAEIKSGLSEGDTVFEAYITDRDNGYGGGIMIG